MTINAVQKSILDATLQFILDSIDNAPTELAIKALESISDQALYKKHQADFEKENILDCVDQLRQIAQHPCPQNRSDSSPYLTLGPWNYNYERDEVISESHGDAIVREQRGLLSLTAYGNETTADEVKSYLHEQVQARQTALQNKKAQNKEFLPRLDLLENIILEENPPEPETVEAIRNSILKLKALHEENSSDAAPLIKKISSHYSEQLDSSPQEVIATLLQKLDDECQWFADVKQEKKKLVQDLELSISPHEDSIEKTLEKAKSSIFEKIKALEEATAILNLDLKNKKDTILGQSYWKPITDTKQQCIDGALQIPSPTLFFGKLFDYVNQNRKREPDFLGKMDPEDKEKLLKNMGQYSELHDQYKEKNRENTSELNRLKHVLRPLKDLESKKNEKIQAIKAKQASLSFLALMRQGKFLEAEAAFKPHWSEEKKAFQHGFSINQLDAFGHSALYYALYHKNIPYAYRLLKDYKADPILNKSDLPFLGSMDQYFRNTLKPRLENRPNVQLVKPVGRLMNVSVREQAVYNEYKITTWDGRTYWDALLKGEIFSQASLSLQQSMRQRFILNQANDWSPEEDFNHLKSAFDQYGLLDEFNPEYRNLRSRLVEIMDSFLFYTIHESNDPQAQSFKRAFKAFNLPLEKLEKHIANLEALKTHIANLKALEKHVAEALEKHFPEALEKPEADPAPPAPISQPENKSIFDLCQLKNKGVFERSNKNTMPELEELRDDIISRGAAACNTRPNGHGTGFFAGRRSDITQEVYDDFSRAQSERLQIERRNDVLTP